MWMLRFFLPKDKQQKPIAATEMQDDGTVKFIMGAVAMEVAGHNVPLTEENGKIVDRYIAANNKDRAELARIRAEMEARTETLIKELTT